MQVDATLGCGDTPVTGEPVAGDGLAAGPPGESRSRAGNDPGVAQGTS